MIPGGSDERKEFDFSTKTEEGAIFALEGDRDGTLTFHLQTGAKLAPIAVSHVFIGSKGAHPAALPFDLSTDWPSTQQPEPPRK